MSLPPVWMVYIVVENLEESLTACREGGGEILLGPKEVSPGSTYGIIRDPAGAVCALYQVGS
jgi:predicted enzyme related to lactoylglutathione lyase